jgi:hypothetical protein
MTNDARTAVHQMLSVLGGTMVNAKTYEQRTDIIHGMLRMANHLLPLSDYPTEEINEIFDTVLALRTEEMLEKWRA